MRYGGTTHGSSRVTMPRSVRGSFSNQNTDEVGLSYSQRGQIGGELDVDGTSNAEIYGATSNGDPAKSKLHASRCVNLPRASSPHAGPVIFYPLSSGFSAKICHEPNAVST